MPSHNFGGWLLWIPVTCCQILFTLYWKIDGKLCLCACTGLYARVRMVSMALATILRSCETGLRIHMPESVRGACLSVNETTQ